MASLVDEWFSKYLLFHLFFFLSRCLDWMMVVMGQKSIIFHRQQQKREEYSAVYCTWFTILRLSRSPSAFSFSHRYSYFYLLLHLIAISVIFFKDENSFLWVFFWTSLTGKRKQPGFASITIARKKNNIQKIFGVHKSWNILYIGMVSNKMKRIFETPIVLRRYINICINKVTRIYWNMRIVLFLLLTFVFYFHFERKFR